nr:hypothetical protein [Candidatus Enterousia merdequi]
MKLSKLLLSFIAGISFVGGVNAADITIFYAPTCPHCHHARDFISNNLIYEYDNLKVKEVNVTNADNRQAFVDALFKCGYQKGGVPVLVIGEKCFQGYADSMQQNLRDAIEADLTQEQKNAAVANKAALESNRDAFVASHSDRKNAISEKDNQKKNNQ